MRFIPSIALVLEIIMINQENVENFGEVLAKCDQFIGLASPEQIRWAISSDLSISGPDLLISWPHLISSPSELLVSPNLITS